MTSTLIAEPRAAGMRRVGKGADQDAPLAQQMQKRRAHAFDVKEPNASTRGQRRATAYASRNYRSRLCPPYAAPCLAKRAGANLPSYSNSTGPVISTWSSRSRQQ